MDHLWSCFKGKESQEGQGCQLPWEERTREQVEQDFLEKYGKPRPDVEHVVVLMLENRTFDNIFGVFMDRRYQSGEIERSSWDQDGQPLYEYSNKVTRDDEDTIEKIKSVSDDAGCYGFCEKVLHSLHHAAHMSPIQVNQYLPARRKHKQTGTGKKHDFKVWSRNPDTEDIYSEEAMGMPNGDPAEKFHLLNMCLFEKLHVEPDEMDKPTMGGFAQQYYVLEQAHVEKQYKHNATLLHQMKLKLTLHGMQNMEEEIERWPDSTDFEKKRSPAMHVYLPEQMGVFTQLATAFGLSDTYFASCPCQTWPNRLFAANGHCYGYVNNLAFSGELYDEEPNMTFGTIRRLHQFKNHTLFNRLRHAGVEWSIFAGDWSLALLINSAMHDPTSLKRLYKYDQFKEHVDKSQLPEFTWIEPQFLESGGKPPNDMHPPHNTLYAQELVADVYNTLRSNEELWKKTLFIVNCDEGVGIFDHVKPPLAPHPGEYTTAGYTFIDQQRPRFLYSNPFKRYGTRTPCLLASPLLDPGSVVRPDRKLSATPEGKLYPFDHTSVIRTVLDLFVGTEYFLTERDRQAPSFAPYLRQTAREDLGPTDVELPSECPPLHPDKAGKERKKCHGVSLLVNMIMRDTHSDHEHGAKLSSFGKQIHPDSDHPDESHVKPKYLAKQQVAFKERDADSGIIFVRQCIEAITANFSELEKNINELEVRLAP